MIRHFCFLCITACSLWAAVITLFVAACSSGGGARDQDDGTVKLFLGKIQVPLFDSISVLVSAADIENIHVSATSLDDNIRINGIPLGENRKFEVKVYADRGKLVQNGEANADIIANKTTTIPISLTALYGFLRLEIPIGLANSENIHSGTLFLNGLKFQMQVEGGKGIFITGALPLNQNLSLSLKLYDSSGRVLFTGEKEITLSSISQIETMQLKPNGGSAILELKASLSEPMQILAVIPKSVSRLPKNYGDLFFTEIFPDPKTNGDDFEYMEIYNATLDTLILSSCHITSTTKLNMPENLTLPPMEYLFFGRDSVTNADFHYKTFRLTNTGQNLCFYCGNLVIDSLNYSKTKDSPFPLARGTAMQLPLSNYASRINGASWCSGFSPKQDALCP
ncbi:MAG: lamin tail domain-containing protein [Candidatus Fibromonas sp.]|nr:lamin tail domain-containing protein [Candidatus Fibromonas sp.]